MEIEVRKGFRGNVSVRDYMVKDCIDRGHNLIINHEGKKMTLTPRQLVEKEVSRSSQYFKSKIGTADYQLINFKWEPDEEQSNS